MLKYIKHNLESIDGVAIYPIISLVTFFTVFVVMLFIVLKMKKRYPNLKIAGFAEGTPRELLEEVKQSKPDAILVAYGAPAQEKWIAQYHTKIPSLRIGIGVGGTFDFWAGKTKRAPQWAQNIGIEWLWRLLQEPRTRMKRIWKAIFVFSYHAIGERFQTKE